MVLFLHAEALVYIWIAIFPDINGLHVVSLIKYQQLRSARKFSVVGREALNFFLLTCINE